MELLRTVARKLQGLSFGGKALRDLAPRQELRQGELVRVRVLRKTAPGSVLVDIRGRARAAHLKGPVPGRLFMARVQSVLPRVVLKYVRDLTGTTDALADRLFRILQDRDLLVGKMFRSRVFFQHPAVALPGSLRNVREALRREASQRQGASLRRMTGRGQSRPGHSVAGTGAPVTQGGEHGEITGYLGLQHLRNILDLRSFTMLFPLLMGSRKAVGSLRMLAGEEEQGNGFVLSVVLEDETKIIFVVFIDYERIRCSVSTSCERAERWIRGHRELLVNAIRSSCYGRKVEVQVLPGGELDDRILHVRRVDLRL
jgi:hypothetical protein